MKLTYYTLIFFFIFQNAKSQINPEWSVYFNSTGNNDDISYSTNVDNNGNVYSGGYCNQNVTGNDICLIKYSNNGVIIWVRYFNGTGNNDDRAYQTDIDNSGNILISGYIRRGQDYNTQDAIIIKYNPSGDIIWSATYNGIEDGPDAVLSFTLDSNDNVYMTGFSNGSGNPDIFTIKLDSSGVQKWLARYNGPVNGTDIGNSVSVDLNGNVCVTGSSQGYVTFTDYITIKYDKEGNELWNERYNGPGSIDVAKKILCDWAGNIYITGESDGGFNHSFDFTTIKYNPNGNQMWIKRYNGPDSSFDHGQDMLLDSIGNIYVTGQSWGNGQNSDFCLVKYNNYGDELWVRRFNGTGNQSDISNKVFKDNYNFIYVTGFSFSSNMNNDILIVKYDPLGNLLWANYFNGTSNKDDMASDIAFDSLNNFYVTGVSRALNNYWDICNIKYTEIIGIQQISTTNPTKNSLLSIYPNPFNPETNITFEITKKDKVVLEVYNSLGKKVNVIISQNLNAGTYKVKWSAVNLPSGIYFCRLMTEEFISTQKMLYLK